MEGDAPPVRPQSICNARNFLFCSAPITTREPMPIPPSILDRIEVFARNEADYTSRNDRDSRQRQLKTSTLA